MMDIECVLLYFTKEKIDATFEFKFKTADF